jgi:hypothetical protein
MDGFNPSVKSSGVGSRADRRVIAPPAKPPQNYRVLNSSAQQIKFRLSGFEEMPELDGTPESIRTNYFPVMPKPGRTIPKFGVEEIAAAIENTFPPPATPAVSKQPVGSGKKGLISRFDDAVVNASNLKTHNKAALIKNKLMHDLNKRVNRDLRNSDPLVIDNQT